MKKLFSYVLMCLLISLFSIGCGKTSEPAETTPASGTQISEPDATPDDTATPEEPANLDNLGAKLSTTYAEMMKNEKYFMKYKMTSEYDGESIEVEATVAVSGDNAAVNSSSGGIKSSIISRGDTTYMINHSEKKVMEIPPNSVMSGDMDDNQIGTDELTYVSSGTEDGLTYEEYSTTDGAIKYYFDGKKLVKISFDVEGETMVFNIIEMNSNVSDSMFEVPADYEKTTLQ